jgi:hypothetical protein
MNEDLERGIHHEIKVVLRTLIAQKENNPSLADRAVSQSADYNRFITAQNIILGQCLAELDGHGVDSLALLKQWRDQLSKIEILPE